MAITQFHWFFYASAPLAYRRVIHHVPITLATHADRLLLPRYGPPTPDACFLPGSSSKPSLRPLTSPWTMFSVALFARECRAGFSYEIAAHAIASATCLRRLLALRLVPETAPRPKDLPVHSTLNSLLHLPYLKPAKLAVNIFRHFDHT